MRLLFTALACLISVSVIGQNPVVGDMYGDGQVFWVDEKNPTQGLLVSAENIQQAVFVGYDSTLVEGTDLWIVFPVYETQFFIWGPYGAFEGAGNSNIGSGLQNTLEINSEFYDFDNIAATHCIEDDENWHLPSKDELETLINVLNTNFSFSNYLYQYVTAEGILNIPIWSSTKENPQHAWAYQYPFGMIATDRLTEGNVIGVKYYDTTTMSSPSIFNPSPRKFDKVVDVLGREVNQTTNQILFHIYDDGSVEKKFIVE